MFAVKKKKEGLLSLCYGDKVDDDVTPLDNHPICL